MPPSQIFVVRHGQASARAHDYDVLSSLGARQATHLGTHFARAGVRFDAVFAGPRRRHRDTARHLVEAVRAAGGDVPDAIELPGSDEIPLGAILALWLPRYIDTDPVARAVAERRFDYSDDEIRALLRRAMVAWADGEVVSPSLPSFAMFASRIADSLAHLRAHAETTLLVTSAGPMAATLHLCGHAAAPTPAATMALTVAIENCAVTRVAADGARLIVADALGVTHLPDADRSLM
ncbi:MAG TPA: histidine phosphatase family protein [Polyangia bacterium]|nr:histidine phosphatase family protein [Polyangia bacterium]